MNTHTLRLGLVGPIAPPNGGMALQTEQLAQLLTAEGVAVERLATNGAYHPTLIARIPGLRALFRLVPYLLAAWRLAGRVDVIHLMANSGWSWQLHAAPVLWLGWLRHTPVIVNYRGGEAKNYFHRSFHRVKPSLQKAAAVVVPSGYLEAVFQEFGANTQVIPNIIDRRIFKSCSTAPANPFADEDTEKPFTLVITRNLEPLYGIDTALKAFAMAYAREPKLRLRIAGSGPSESSLRALAAELGVVDVVSFEGRLDRAGIVALYADADAMVNPSTVDNMPNSVIEALSCGVPVISTNVGGVPFIVRHEESALLVEPGNESALAAAIMRLQADGALRDRLTTRGVQQVEQYTWPRVRTLWLELYDQLSDRERRHAL